MHFSAESYLRENIDDQINITAWRKNNTIPLFLRTLYNFYQMTILDVPCILIEILDEIPGIDAIQKHMTQISKITNDKIVLYFHEITQYRRRTLIKHHIAFLIEDGEMFMPFLGLNLKKAPRYIEDRKQQFTISTQRVFLYFLYNKGAEINALQLSEKMGFTHMTATRALKSLYVAKLVSYEIGGITGRSKKYRRISDPEYFQKGIQYVKSPIRDVVYVEQAPEDALIAGLDALAQISMMNPTGYPVRAISYEQFKRQAIDVIDNKDMVKDKKVVMLELWNYDPKEFSDEKIVDLMSLYASLMNKNDERIEQSLRESLLRERWYTD